MGKFSINKKAGIIAIILIFSMGNVIGVSASSSLKEITAYLDEGVRLIVNGSPFTAKDSDGKKLDPINYNGNIYIPLRSVAEAVGMEVKWDNTSRTASLGIFKEEQQGDKIYTSSDKTFQISMPSNWIRNDQFIQEVSPTIKFGAVNNKSKSNSYLAVSAIAKMGFSPTVNIEDYTRMVMYDLKSRVGNVTIKSQTDLKIDKYSAKKYEISTTIKDINFVRVLIFIETDNKFYEIEMWSATTELGPEKDEVMKIASTFKELSN